jgi:uncharacterized damage-inducible protein DinB
MYGRGRLAAAGSLSRERTTPNFLRVSDTPITGESAGRIFIEMSKYLLTREYSRKIRQCLEVLPESAVWARSNDGSNSIGNLLLHLTGNVTEWIVGGVAQRKFARNRPAEFAARDGGGVRQLLTGLDEALRDAAKVLDGLLDEDLAAGRFIQGRETSGRGAIYHVVEHFAMHAGQIVLLTKIHAPGAIHFYDDSGPVANPLWKRGDDVAKIQR